MSPVHPFCYSDSIPKTQNISIFLQNDVQIQLWNVNNHVNNLTSIDTASCTCSKQLEKYMFPLTLTDEQTGMQTRTIDDYDSESSINVLKSSEALQKQVIVIVVKPIRQPQ